MWTGSGDQPKLVSQKIEQTEGGVEAEKGLSKQESGPLDKELPSESRLPRPSVFHSYIYLKETLENWMRFGFLKNKFLSFGVYSGAISKSDTDDKSLLSNDLLVLLQLVQNTGDIRPQSRPYRLKAHF